MSRPGTRVAVDDGRMRLRLTRKLADEIDGIDLSHHHVGDTFDMPTRDGQMLIAEGWGERDRRGDGSQAIVIAFRRATDPGPLRLDEVDDLSRAS